MRTNRFRWTMLTNLIFAGIAGLAGCSGDGGLLKEPGLYVYEGVSVQRRETLFDRAMEGEESNRIDIQKAKRSPYVFERIPIYVEPAAVADLSRNSVAYTGEELSRLLTRATETSVSQFGRFERVKTKPEAQLVVQAELSSVNAWADKMISDKEAEIVTKRSPDGSRAVMQNINREAVDVFLTVTFGRPNGTEIASIRSMGRLVATQGNAIESGTFALRDGGAAKGKATLEVKNAKIKPTELPRVLTAAVDGGIAAALDGPLGQLWQPKADAAGMRQVQRTLLHPTSPASASEK